MPRKSKKKSSSSNVLIPKVKQGRPRKAVAPEALLPYNTDEETTEKDRKSLKNKLEPPKAKLTNRRMSPTTSNRNYTPDEVEFMNALDEFKRASGRTFPTCSEILDILRKLGYEKGIETF
jgi:predicted ribonuclease toxin of YeeF-YezG toxin-antitoxin module